MTRGKQIIEEAKRIIAEAHERGNNDPMVDLTITLSFSLGARWADKHPQWISVEDELPPRFPLNPNESMNVITYGLHTMVNWYDYERGEWVRDSEITHWMPLPQAPKKGD